MQLNAEDGGKRRHIMVQLPEPCDEKSEAFKAATRPSPRSARSASAAPERRFWQSGRPSRRKKSPRKATSRSAIAESPLRDLPQTSAFASSRSTPRTWRTSITPPDELTRSALTLQADNIKPDRTPEDLLFQVLLDWGVDLALAHHREKILKGNEVFFVDGNALAACFDTGHRRGLRARNCAKRKPLARRVPRHRLRQQRRQDQRRADLQGSRPPHGDQMHLVTAMKLKFKHTGLPDGRRRGRGRLLRRASRRRAA